MGQIAEKSKFLSYFQWEEKSKKNFLQVISNATSAEPEKVEKASKRLLAGAT